MGTGGAAARSGRGPEPAAAMAPFCEADGFRSDLWRSEALRDLTPLLPITSALAATAARRSLSDWLHILAFGAIGWPWLLKSLSGGTMARRTQLCARLDLPEDALPHLGSWKADAGFLHLIVDHIQNARPRVVVEFGAGASTFVAARALMLHGGGRLVSFDQNPDFAAQTRSWLRSYGVDADIRAVPLCPSPGGWPGLWYDHEPVDRPIDLLLIDGPPWTIHPYVRGAAEALFDDIAPGGCVMLDDAARPGERVVARRWSVRWPDFDFRLRHAGSKGTLVGVRSQKASSGHTFTRRRRAAADPRRDGGAADS